MCLSENRWSTSVGWCQKRKIGFHSASRWPARRNIDCHCDPRAIHPAWLPQWGASREHQHLTSLVILTLICSKSLKTASVLNTQEVYICSPHELNRLSNYKVLYDVTTCWCPEREEHGYIYVPMFKCNTNPRIATAHRWLIADVIGRMNKPTGRQTNPHRSQLTRLQSVSITRKASGTTPGPIKPSSWISCLRRSGPSFHKKLVVFPRFFAFDWVLTLHKKSVSTIVKETLVGRKNISPQNTYETTQLYAVGALRVTCVGLHCIGFNQEIYKAILEHAGKFSESKWKSLATASAKVLAAATQANPNSTSNGGKEVQTATTPVLVKTPIIGKHSSRTPGHLSTSTSSNGSPGSIYAKSFASVSPQLGLGFGSSTWNMWANDISGTSPSLSLVVPMSGVAPPVEAKQNKHSEATWSRRQLRKGYTSNWDRQYSLVPFLGFCKERMSCLSWLCKLASSHDHITNCVAKQELRTWPTHNFVAGAILCVRYLAPPSSRMWVPVMCDPAGEDRKRASPAISEGKPILPAGWPVLKASSPACLSP